MGPSRDIVRFQPDLFSRWTPLLAGPVMLGVWIWMMRPIDDYSMLPAAIVLAAALSGFAGWLSFARAVTLTPTHLVSRSHRGVTTFDWADITALQRRWTGVWVMTREGWFVLPLSIVTRARRRDRDPERTTLDQAVWRAWVERRGEDWTTGVLDPWRPTLDVRGRVVLRAPMGPALYWLAYQGIFFVAFAMSNTLTSTRPPDDARSDTLAPMFVIAAVGVALALLYRAWSRVTIDDHEIVVRSITAGRLRVPRHQVHAVREIATTFPLAGRGTVRLAIDIADRPGRAAGYRTFSLPAPVTSEKWHASDPQYHRKWAWLHDVLTAATAVEVGPVRRSDAEDDPNRMR